MKKFSKILPIIGKILKSKVIFLISITFFESKLLYSIPQNILTARKE